MTNPRLFLVAPEGLAAAQVLACAAAACAAGDCASILVAPSTPSAIIAELQNLGLAVLGNGAANDATDGLQIDAATLDVAPFRKSLGKSTMIGAFCGASRHVAMEAAEQGADYVAFCQTQQTKGEPLLSWWVDLFEIPVVAYDPVTASDLDILLPQKPDFLRPSNAMWESPTAATQIISELSLRLNP